VNHSFVRFGAQVAHALFEGGTRFWRHEMAKKRESVEEERALLLALSVLYEVDFRILAAYRTYDVVVAREAGVKSQEQLLTQILGRYREGLETGPNAVQSFAQLQAARFFLDQARTEYQIAWYELAASIPLDAELPERRSEPPAVPPEPLPPLTPGLPLDELQKIVATLPVPDLRRMPELKPFFEKLEKKR
jgi:outer membrane protein TolC